MRERVVCYHTQPRVMEVRALELNVHRLVVRVAIGTPVIDIGILTCQSCEPDVSTCVLKWIPKEHIASAEGVYVLDVIQMEPTGAGILKRHYRVACQLLLQCRIPELRLRCADVLIHMPQAGGRQRDTTRGPPQWTGIRASDLRIVDDDDCVIRRILNH